MSDSFAQTARGLARDSSTGMRLLLVSAAVLLAGWGAWFATAKIPVYETSDQARLEVARATNPVDAPAAGRVVEAHVALGDAVNEGDVLVRLDSSAEELALAQARARIAALGPEIEAIEGEITADVRALGTYEEQLAGEVAQAEARVREAEIVTRAGRDEADRAKRLLENKVGSEADYDRARDEADRRAADESAVRLQLDKVRREWATGSADRRARVASLRRDAAQLEGERGSLEGQLPSLENAIERRTIRAPATGKIGEVGAVRVGSVLAQGDHIATVLAHGNLRVVAAFEPAAAFGRVKAGQRARLRLDGFPWTEYGTLTATVTDVATELHEGKARVELTMDDASAARIPLQHGLPGAVDVTVEEASPLSLVLRAAGRPRS